ncbi:MAG: coiled-coil domain-containing protein 22 [Lachnospiraceae bacterium]|nr:coiled-coil domain-containing protein 22 [Lachnospiraceae bacterium]
MTKSTQTVSLAEHFPSIRTQAALRQIIASHPDLESLFAGWDPASQEDFLKQCSGEKGMTILYDGIFKEIFTPEGAPERLSRLLSLLLERKVTVLKALPNDSVRLGAESSLLYTDIMVQMEDGSLCDVEVQKIGYAFPGQRCACYSSDHLLRQYKRVHGEKGKKFSYRDIKPVYTIVFFEHSTAEFHAFPGQWIHRFKQQSDTGLTIDLLQEYILIPLDIYRKNMENRPIGTDLEAWLAFLSFTEPARIDELITHYPMFKDMYQQIYDLCLDIGKVMKMYSKELATLDHNTVMYMIDEMQEQVDEYKQTISQQEQTIAQNEQTIAQNEQTIADLKAQLAALQ